jgi:hypothetical protein
MDKRRRFTIQDFWSFVPADNQNNPTCSLWKGNVHSGYGYFPNQLGLSERAHRAMWELKHGKIPKGMCVCHHCDTPLCVRISHLFLGSISDNNKDMAAKNRGRTGDHNGEKNGMALLTEAEVLTIRKLANEGISKWALASQFQISAMTVYEITTRRKWTHI